MRWDSLDPYQAFARDLAQAIRVAFPELAENAPSATEIQVNPPRDGEHHGEIVSNVAMTLAKVLRKPPMEIASALKMQLDSNPAYRLVVAARPGFLNATLAKGHWQAVLRGVLSYGPDGFGASERGGGRRVNVEYVSANPTGPLHVAHARGAVIGDVLANLLEKTGYEVVREYYTNDAGSQVRALCESFFLRYRQALGEDIGSIPEGGYPGEYLIPPAKVLAEKEGRALLELSEEARFRRLRPVIVKAMMDLIRKDLARLGIVQAVFTSEYQLIQDGAADRALMTLGACGAVYRGTLERPRGMSNSEGEWDEREQLLFRSTDYGDDRDRALKKANGEWTYFGGDIANHLDKIRRGAQQLVVVLGADHAGYAKRVQAAVQAASGGKVRLDAFFCQIVRLMKAGKPAVMSKRSGNFVTLADLIDAVGRDVVRFFLLTRRADAPLDFDVDQVTEQSRENPVFYVHYAHARCASLFRQADEGDKPFTPEELTYGALATADLSRLVSDDETRLMRQIALWPRFLEQAATALEPHRISYYLMELAGCFHAFWTQGKLNAEGRVITSDRERSRARLALVAATSVTLKSGLELVAVEPLDVLE